VYLQNKYVAMARMVPGCFSYFVSLFCQQQLDCKLCKLMPNFRLDVIHPGLYVTPDEKKIYILGESSVTRLVTTHFHAFP
jgi:hypothetical protein